jgi:hypothetical protein
VRYATTPPTLSTIRFGVRMQLIFAFGLLVALVVAVVGVALWGMTGVDESARQATTIDGQQNIAVYRL